MPGSLRVVHGATVSDHERYDPAAKYVYIIRVTDLSLIGCTGATKEHLVNVIARSKLSHPILAERLSKYETLSDWTSKSSEDLRCSGWVIDTLEVALWSFFKYSSWKEGALAVVNLGEDSDTAGAVYGALAGAFFGYDEIPASWIHTMQRKELISEIAGRVAELSCLSTEDRLR
jgi:ADP-ribosyl-[dinitrogen reductase] hydrolase